MRFTEIALCDSSPRRICEFLTNICAFRVKSVEETFIEDRSGVVVGKILQVLSMEMESGKELAILFMREIRSDYSYGGDFKALILGRVARMLYLARPEVGDRLAFSNGKIYPDSCFSASAARYPYSTTYNIEIGPVEKDQVLLVRKQNHMNQPQIPVLSVAGNNNPPIPELVAKVRHLENTVNNFIALGPTNGKNTRPSRSDVSKNKNICSHPDSSITPSKKSLGSKPEIKSLANSALVSPSNHSSNSKAIISKAEHKNNIGSCGIEAQGDTEKKNHQKPEQVMKISDSRRLHSNYVYDSIEKIKQTSTTGTTRVNLFGLVNDIIKPLAWTEKGKRHMICQLVDDSRNGENLLVCHFFTADDNILKHVERGDVLRLHRVKIEANNYEGVDGRVFNNNDMLLFKSKSDIDTPIKTARVTEISDAQKKRVKELLDWYNNYKGLTEETDIHATERRTRIPNESSNDSSTHNPDNNVTEFMSKATTSTSLKKDSLNNIESKSESTNQMKSKKPVINNLQLKKRHLYVPKENDHLSIARDNSPLSVSRITPVRTNKAPIDIDKNLNLSFESYISAQKRFQTSTPKKGVMNFNENKKIQQNALQVNIPVTRLAEDQIGLSGFNESNKQPSTSSIVFTDCSDTSTNKNKTTRKRKQKIGDDDKPSYTKRKTSASDLHLNVDKRFPTIKNGENFGSRDVIERMQDDSDREEDSDSSLIELNSSEAEDLLGGFNEQQHGGQRSPIPGSSQSSFNSSSIDGQYLLRPDQIAVKAYITRITPDPCAEPLNLVSGLCREDCHTSVFTDLLRVDHEENVVPMFTNLDHIHQEENIVPICPICFKCRGLKRQVELMFMITFDLLDVKNGYKAEHVILCGSEASLSLGCSVEQFMKDENIRREICKKLKYLLLETDFGTSFELGIHCTPKILILSPDSVLKQIFMVDIVQSMHEN